MNLLSRITGLLSGPKARAGVPVTPRQLYSGVPDDRWLWLNTEGLRTDPQAKAVLPGLPPERIQINWTGAAGDVTLTEAHKFYVAVKGYADRFGTPLAKSQRVLDFGCGWGRIVRFFLKDLDGHRLHGIDCYPEALELARANNRYCRFDRVDPHPPTELPANSYDLVYAFSVFSHLSEAAHKAWLAEFRRLLKPGGLAVLTTRDRHFIEFCGRVREEQKAKALDEHLFGPALAFPDVAASLRAYDAGEFCYSGVGGGGVLDGSFYGETAIPEGYVRKHWTDGFEVVDFLTDRNVCVQNIAVVRKK